MILSGPAEGTLLIWRRLALLTAVALMVTACGTTATSPTASESMAASAAGSPDELPIGEESMRAGQYFLPEFPVGITFEIPAHTAPAEWIICSASAVEQGVCYSSTGVFSTGTSVAVAFQIVDNVRTPPCSDQETAELLDPPVGSSVDDFVTAISNLEGYETTPPEDISVNGFSGKEFTLTAVSHGCGATWSTTDRVTGMGAGEINLLRVLDVDGLRVLMTGAYDAATPETELSAMNDVLDSVRIQE